jgi:hypothetical protein
LTAFLPVGKLVAKNLGHGTNPLAVLAHQRTSVERCAFAWAQRERDLDPHEHKCKRLPGHISEHRCTCGATIGERERYRLRRR